MLGLFLALTVKSELLNLLYMVLRTGLLLISSISPPSCLQTLPTNLYYSQNPEHPRLSCFPNAEYFSLWILAYTYLSRWPGSNITSWMKPTPVDCLLLPAVKCGNISSGVFLTGERWSMWPPLFRIFLLTVIFQRLVKAWAPEDGCHPWLSSTSPVVLKTIGGQWLFSLKKSNTPTCAKFQHYERYNWKMSPFLSLHNPCHLKYPLSMSMLPRLEASSQMWLYSFKSIKLK